MTEQIAVATRKFKIGSTLLDEDDSTRGLDLEQIRSLLKPAFPEVADAAIVQNQIGDVLYIEYTSRPGRKG
jgi:hypothetical protein